MHPATERIMQFFDHGYLPEELRWVSEHCACLAENMNMMLVDGPEKTVALRKLLEARDGFIRAAMTNETNT